mmetsp:Transcript_14060/g.29378  ORF Transcript_14060/g.29378 Transcript_14060/m.29378 type:complete len:313 (-) Transcript_14060:743-1681(-)
MPIRFVVLLEQSAHVFPSGSTPSLPHHPEFRQSLFSLGIQFVASLGLALSGQPLSELFPVLLVLVRYVAMPVSPVVLLQHCIHIVPRVRSPHSAYSPHDSDRLHLFLFDGIEFSVLLCLALVSQPVPEILTIFSMRMGNIAVSLPCFVQLQQDEHVFPRSDTIPRDTQVFQPLPAVGIEFSGPLGVPLYGQPHAEVFSVLSVFLSHVAVAVGAVVLLEQSEHIFPRAGGPSPSNSPRDAEIGQACFPVGVEYPVLLEMALFFQPRSEVLAILSVQIGNVAVPFSFLVLFQQCVHHLPFTTSEIPYDTEFVQF